MTEPGWPYNLPIWQGSLRLDSPNGKMWAKIENAVEVSMGNPTVGILETSTGLLIEHCNPSFIWSDDSTYILVAQYSFNRIWGYGKQRLLVIDVKQNTKWQSPRLAHYIQPESFDHGDISFVMNPFKNPITRNYSIDTIMQTFEALPALPDKRLPSDPAKPGR